MAKMQRKGTKPSQTKEYSHEEEEDEEGIFLKSFICEICMNPVSEEMRFRNQKRCSHSLCVDCISDYIKVMVEKKKIVQIRCPDLYCDNLLDPLSCSSILSTSVFKKWWDLVCELEVLQPPWAYRSNERRRIGDGDGDGDGDDLLLTLLAEKNKWTRCPGCNCFVERIDGCSIIHCRCGTHFCHDCREERGWHWWCGCKYEKMDEGGRGSMYFVTLLLIIFCYVILIWSVRYEALFETLP